MEISNIRTYRDLAYATDERGIRRLLLARYLDLDPATLSRLLKSDPEGRPSKRMVERFFAAFDLIAARPVEATK